MKLLGQLDRLLWKELTRLFAATLGGVVLIYLVIDFADRAHAFSGRAWGRYVLELYANKAAVVGYQLAPGALIIATALLITLLSRRGELTALYALGVRPLRIALPVLAFSALVGVLLFQLNERVVVRADARVDEIMLRRFNRWGDWATYHAGSAWLKGKQGRVYHLGGEQQGGWEPATVLEIAPPFRLSRRIDARRIEPLGAGRWRLLDAVETRYALSDEPGGSVEERRHAVLEESFPETAEDLELRSGRPRQLPWRQLREQLQRRQQAGQRVREWELALVERAAQPLQVVPATLAALALMLAFQKPRRRNPLAGAVALGLALTLVLWAVSVVAHAVSLSGSLAPLASGALPSLVSLGLALAGFGRRA